MVVHGVETEWIWIREYGMDLDVVEWIGMEWIWEWNGFGMVEWIGVVEWWWIGVVEWWWNGME
jgi:hypothetical protein